MPVPQQDTISYDPKKHHRRSIRLQGYNYGCGMFFVTICAEGRNPIFGEIRSEIMGLSKTGGMIVDWWQKLPEKFPHVELDSFVVMPNHFHAVLTVVVTDAPLRGVSVGADPCVCPDSVPRPDGEGAHAGAPLPAVIQWFKTMTTNEYLRVLKERGEPPSRLWQRNYFEHVIRNDKSLDRIRDYIHGNPARWYLDRENPEQHGRDEFDQWLDTFNKSPKTAPTSK